MRTLGLIGGTTWVSTVDYYRIINQLTNERLGGLTSAKILMYSLNFEEFKPPADPAEWGQRAELLIGIAQRLEHGGADCIVICANTPHLLADTIQKNIHIPLIHIAEATAKEVAKQNISSVGLLGTKTTMEQSFFKDRLLKNDIATVIPDDADRDFIHWSIFSEMGKNIFSSETKKKYLEIIAKLKQNGAKGIIFGCTEIPTLLKPEDCDIPTFDTTYIHARAAVEFALS